MPDPLVPVREAVAAGRPDDAASEAASALAGKVSLLNLARTAAYAGATTADLSRGFLPHGLMTLSSSLRLASHMPGPGRSLPVLRAIVALAAEPKAPPTTLPVTRIEGEPMQLASSFKAAVRAGRPDDAVRIFLGFIRTGRERRIAGDILFQAALEDRAEGGHRLLYAVQVWQLARGFGWTDALPLLRPCLRYLANDAADRTAFESSWAASSRAMLNPEAASDQSRALTTEEDDAFRSALSDGAESTVETVIRLLKAGAGPAALADTLARYGAGRVASMPQPDFPALHAYQFAEAARFVVAYSRSPERIGALFQAAHGLGGSAGRGPSAVEPSASDGDRVLVALAEDLAARDSARAVGRIRAYLRRGLNREALLAFLAREAARSDARVSTGHTIQTADTALSLFVATDDPIHLDAVANVLAQAPRDETVPEAWHGLLGP